jgi:hypothetical protein
MPEWLNLEKKGQDYDHHFWEICPKTIGNLNELIFNTGAEVIVSSTWRLGRTADDIQKILDKRGFEGNIIDVTPRLSFNGVGGSVPRGSEIDQWLRNNNFGWPFNRYVILDDDSDMLLNQRENFFWCDPYSGLTPNIAYKATHFLNRP